MFDIQQSKDILAAYCAFWVLSMVFSVTTLLTKDPTVLHCFGFFTAIPYGLYGAIALEVFNIFRIGDGLEFPKLANFAIGQAFHGIFGILLFFWTLASFCFGERVISRAPSKTLKAEHGYRSRFFFYLVAFYLTFVGAIVTATALSYRFVPVGYAGCRPERLAGTALVRISRIMTERAEDICNRAVTTQVLGIMTAILAFSHAMTYMRLVAYPRILRYTLYMIFHKPSPSSRPYLREKDHADDVEKLLPKDDSTLFSEGPGIHRALTDDRIAQEIAGHLHFIDISNLSRASRAVRQSIRGNRNRPTEERAQMFFNTCCVSGEKTECWACARMVCNSCRQLRCNIPQPRTETHATNCFAVCTTCFLLRAPALPPPRAALSRADDLSVQHNECWKMCATRSVLKGNVTLCKSCNLLPTNEDVSEVREKRDAEALRRAHGGRLWCAECQKSLGKGRRRWFICETGGHECHWLGHQMC